MRLGKLYFFPGNGDGTVGTAQTFNLPYVQWPNTPDDVGYAANAIVSDFTDDDLLDLMLIYSSSADKYVPSSGHGQARIIPNTGSKTNFIFSKSNEIIVKTAGGSTIGSPSAKYQMINYGDMDNDGVKDLLLSSNGTGLTWYRNDGSNTKPSFANGESLNYGSGLTGSSLPIGFADVDGDSDEDLLMGTGYNRSLYVCDNNGVAAEKFVLTVENGTGSGSYVAGASFSITAKDSAGYAFDRWIGDTGILSSTTSKTATVTMPGTVSKVTATYVEAETFSLAVNNGNNSGSYSNGESITITAKDSSGYLFDKWSGDVEYLSDVSAKTTTVTMPSKDIAVTAEYRESSVTIDTINPSENLVEWGNPEISLDGYGSTIDTGSALLNNGVLKVGFDIVASVDTNYAYGSADLWFPEGDKNNLDQVKYIKVVYKTDDAFKIVLPQVGLMNNGSSYESNLGTTNGSFKTVLITVSDLQQPNWVTTSSSYNGSDVKGISFAMQSAGSTGTIEVKEIILYNYQGEATSIASHRAMKAAKLKTFVSNGSLKLSVSQQTSATVSLFSASGRVIMNSKEVSLSSGINSLELPNGIASGVYYLNVVGTEFKATTLLMIQ